MKTSHSTLVAATFVALASVALTAPTNMPRWELPSNIKDLHLPDSVTFDPEINTGTETTTTNTVNNGDGDGNSGGDNTSNKNSGNGSHNNGKKQRRQRRRTKTGGAKSVQNDGDGDNNGDDEDSTSQLNQGDGDDNHGSSQVTVNKDDGNNAHNTDSHNSEDSHNNDISTQLDIPIFRRTRSQKSNNGDGDDNHGDSQVTVNKDDGNNAYNTDSHDSEDSHNNKVDTSLDIPIFRRHRNTAINNGDGDENTGDSKVTVNKDDGNNSYNTDSHDTTDSHNNSVDTTAEIPLPIFRRHRNTAANNGDGDANTGSSQVTVNKNDGNNAHNEDSHDSSDSHNNTVDTKLDIPIF